MNVIEYIGLIQTRLQRNFNIESNIKMLDQHIELYAKSEIHNESYFASKRVKVWRAENHEFCFVKSYEVLDNKMLKDFQNFLIAAVEHLVRPHSEHMSSIITGVLVVDHIQESLEKEILRFKYKKMYAFTFKGWSDIRLLVVSPHSNKVISNRKGKEVESFYLPIKIEEKKSI